jgi:diadenosine tetraphosphate (Ap4A) HIT family hydrolase
VSLALKELTRYDKINIAAIGNVVPQLHVHIVARRKTDPLWPKPVFGVTPLPRAKEAAFERFVDKVRKKLGAAQMR